MSEEYWSDENWAVGALERMEKAFKHYKARCEHLESKLSEGRDLVDMLATDIPDLAAWSIEVDTLLESLGD